MVRMLVLNPASRKMESPKVLNRLATPVFLIFFLTISSMFSVSGSEPYDYMQYVVQWQPAVCSNPKNNRRCTKLPKQNFTIHGLWPSNFSGAHVIDCRQGHAFDINEVRPIRAELDECWPDMLRRSNDFFWGAEWGKHGRCSLNVFSNQFEYFNRSVTLCNMYNRRIKDILWRAQIYPSDNRGVVWTSPSIAKEIHNVFGKRPVLRCDDKYDPGARSGHYPKQLQEVILCFDEKGEVLIDCPRSRETNCHGFILFSP
ncbi:hypothetical protein SLA2020_166480 [Shorea laevis]